MRFNYFNEAPRAAARARRGTFRELVFPETFKKRVQKRRRIADALLSGGFDDEDDKTIAGWLGVSDYTVHSVRQTLDIAGALDGCVSFTDSELDDLLLTSLEKRTIDRCVQVADMLVAHQPSSEICTSLNIASGTVADIRKKLISSGYLDE